MNGKLITAMTILAVAFCCIAMIPSEDADAASTVTINVTSTTGGTATGGGTFEEGDTVTLTATPNSGYEFVKWTFTGGSSYANPLSYEIQAPMLGQTVTYTANFQSTAPSTHTVSFQSSNSSYGSVSRSTITNVPDGASISVSGNQVTINGYTCIATPTTDTAQYDYSFTSWSNTSGTVTSDRTITANFSRSTNTYTVSFVSNDVSYGSVSRSTITSVPYGSSISVSGNQVTINGTTCTATPSPDTSEYDYSFTGWSNTSGSVTGNRTITANFSRIGTIATINVTSGTGGTATGGGTFEEGDTVTLTATPDSGYRFVNWTFTGGTSVVNPLSYEIQAPMLGQSVTYTANFELIPTVTITVNSSGHGTATGGGTFEEGDTVTLTATPDPGYRFVNWTSTGSGGSGTHVGNPLTFEVQSPMLGQSVTYTANFELIPTTVITVTSGTGGTATGSGTYYLGDTVTLAATPNTGYRFVNWTSTGSGGSATHVGNPLIFDIQAPMLNQSVTYTANFELIPTVTITVNSSGHGTATGGGTFEEGDTVTLTATPDPGYRFVNWTSTGSGGSGTHVGNPLTFEVQSPMLNQSVTYTANFELIPTLNVTVTSGTGGSATGGGTYYLGDTVTLTATPDRGYNFVNWTIPGGYNITENPYIFEVQEPMLNQSVTFTANFEEGQALTIIATSSGNGTVTGSGTYYLGETVSLTATPSEGYTFNKWTFTGGSSYQNPYTFEVAEIMLGSTVTYTATFVEIQNLPDVWWDNGYINGSATIVFDFSGRTASYGHQMIIPIVKYDGVKNDADGIDDFTSTGQIIRISMAYNGYITMTLTDADSTVHNYPSFQIGEWTQYQLKLDVQNGYLDWAGIKSPYRNTALDFSFTNYNTIVERRIVDFSNDLSDAAFNRIYHEDTGTGTSHPHFQVVTTNTYLDTFSVVMTDPIINIVDQFPDYDDLRLNLYSFAVYGDSLNINGYAFDVTGSKVRVYYTVHHDPIYDDQIHSLIGYDDYNEIASPNTPGAKSVDLTLSNIYITWENIKHPDAADRMCYLTFVDANMTFRMGSFQSDNLTISFDGIWYFTTALWEPYQAFEKNYTWDYHNPFNLDRNGFILIFIAISVAVFVLMNIFYRPSALDYAIVIGSGIIAYVLLGGF